MSAQHTPGPWRVRPDSNGWRAVNDDIGSSAYECVLAGDDAVALVVAQGNDPFAEAPPTEHNARLIAAAPDLLAVARFFLRGIEGGHIKCAPYIDFDPDAESLEIKSPADRLREAIAKATGGAA